VIGLPPFEAGGVQLSATLAFPPAAVSCGAPGSVTGAASSFESAPSPSELKPATR
jgi:hypothetical protein